jgi:hypothetical protein
MLQLTTKVAYFVNFFIASPWDFVFEMSRKFLRTVFKLPEYLNRFSGCIIHFYILYLYNAVFFTSMCSDIPYPKMCLLTYLPIFPTISL